MKRRTAQAERQAARLSDRLQRTRATGDERDALAQQLNRLQESNSKLRDQIYNLHGRLAAERKNNISPEELRHRLQNFLHALKTGKGVGESYDAVDNALGELQGKVQQEIDESYKQVDKALQDKTHAEMAAAAIQNEMNNRVRDAQREAEASTQAKIEPLHLQLDQLYSENERLAREVERLRHELDNEKQNNVRKTPSHFSLRATPASAIISEGGMESIGGTELTSGTTIPSSQFTNRCNELYDIMTPEEQQLFDELQREINELRKLLSLQDKKDAVELLDSAENKANRLRNMVAERVNNMGIQPENLNRNGKQKHETHKSTATGPDKASDEGSQLLKGIDDLKKAEESIQYLHKLIDVQNQTEQAQPNHPNHSDHLYEGIDPRLEEPLFKLSDPGKSQPNNFQQIHSPKKSTRPQPKFFYNEEQNPFVSDKIDGAHFNDPLPNTYNNQPQIISANHKPNESIPRTHQADAPYRRHQQNAHSRLHPDYDFHSIPAALKPEVLDKNQNINTQRKYRESETYMKQPAVNTPPKRISNHNQYFNPNNNASVPQPLTTSTFTTNPQTHPFNSQSQPPAHPSSGVSFTQPWSPGGPDPTFINQQGLASTPVAGPGVSSSYNAESQPMMFSTPKQPVTGQSPPGILKAPAVSTINHKLICNVPEHHHLEDYIKKLKKQISNLKNVNQQALFEDNLDKSVVRRLQKALNNRRSELEGLDLAIERQKDSLRKMKGIEKKLLNEKKLSKQRLSQLRSPNFHKFRKLSQSRQLDTSSCDSEFDSYRRVHDAADRFDLYAVQDELSCIELTLRRRRAELRVANALLEKCKSQLVSTKQETGRQLKRQHAARLDADNLANETEQLDARARSAGQVLLRTREELDKTKESLKISDKAKQAAIAEQKRLEALCLNIKEVIQRKDQEFQIADKQCLDAKERLNSIKEELESANHVKDLQSEMFKLKQEREQELSHLSLQTTQHLVELNKTKESLKETNAELQLTEQTLENLRQQIDETSKKADSEMSIKRHAIQNILIEIEQLQTQKNALETKLNLKSEELQKEESKVEHFQKESRRLLIEIDKIKQVLTLGKVEMEDRQKLLQALDTNLAELKHKKSVLEDENKAIEQKCTFIQSKNSSLEESKQKVEAELKFLFEELRIAKKERASLHREMKTINAVLDGDEIDFDTPIHDHNEALDFDKTEVEKQHQLKFSYLEERVRELAHQINQRTKEKEQLVTALNRSGEDLNQLRQSLAKEKDELTVKVQEMQSEIKKLTQERDNEKEENKMLKEKSNRDIIELELIAQSHLSRATRLSEELDYLRSDYLEVERRLQNHLALAGSEKRIENTLKELKHDIKAEVVESISELDRSQVKTSSEVEHLHNQKQNLQKQLSAIQKNINLLQQDRCEHPDPLIVKIPNNFVEQQNFLRNELNEQMNKKQKALHNQQTSSNDCLAKLQNKLSDLELMLAKTTSTEKQNNLRNQTFSSTHTSSPNRRSFKANRSRSSTPTSERLGIFH